MAFFARGLLVVLVLSGAFACLVMVIIVAMIVNVAAIVALAAVLAGVTALLPGVA
jgi:hypothetical protein